MSKRTRSEKDNAGPLPHHARMRRLRVAGRAVQKAAQAQAGDDGELFSPLFERFGWDVDIDPIRGMSGTSASEGKLASPRAFRYKATTPFAPLPDGHIACGFYAAGTHRIVPAADCAVEAPGARRILNEVARGGPRAWACAPTTRTPTAGCCATPWCAWAGARTRACSPW